MFSRKEVVCFCGARKVVVCFWGSLFFRGISRFGNKGKKWGKGLVVVLEIRERSRLKVVS
ncbi:hypothetical protein VPHD51_0196 [Vibrio phage D51]